MSIYKVQTWGPGLVEELESVLTEATKARKAKKGKKARTSANKPTDPRPKKTSKKPSAKKKAKPSPKKKAKPKKAVAKKRPAAKGTKAAPTKAPAKKTKKKPKAASKEISVGTQGKKDPHRFRELRGPGPGITHPTRRIKKRPKDRYRCKCHTSGASVICTCKKPGHAPERRVQSKAVRRDYMYGSNDYKRWYRKQAFARKWTRSKGMVPAKGASAGSRKVGNKTSNE